MTRLPPLLQKVLEVVDPANVIFVEVPLFAFLWNETWVLARLGVTGVPWWVFIPGSYVIISQWRGWWRRRLHWADEWLAMERSMEQD